MTNYNEYDIIFLKYNICCIKKTVNSAKTGFMERKDFMFCQKCGRETGEPIKSCPICGEEIKLNQTADNTQDTLLKTFGLLFCAYGRVSFFTLIITIIFEAGDLDSGLFRLLLFSPIAFLCRFIEFFGIMVFLKKKWAVLWIGIILTGMGISALALIFFGNHVLIAAANLIFVIGLLIGANECRKILPQKGAQ